MNLMRRVLLAAVILSALAVLSGCPFQFATPSIEIRNEGAYNEAEILIPYSLTGDSSFARARWRLREFDAPTGVWLQEREVRLPSGGSGVIELGNLPEYEYEIEISLLTTRDGTFEVVPYLTRTVGFFVDRTPPAGYTFEYIDDGGVFAGQGGATAPFSGLPGPPTFVDVRIDPDPLLPGESPVRVLAIVDEFRPLEPGTDDERPIQWELWSDTDPQPLSMTFQLIDEAGNRGPIQLESY